MKVYKAPFDDFAGEDELDSMRPADRQDRIRNYRPTCLGPSIIESEKYPALDEAWKRLTEEYEVIHKLTLGK